jgi:thymidylate synthase (FAD)
MNERIKLLDHGYLQFVESWGSDEMVIECARMSTAKGFLGWGGAPCPQCEVAGRLSEVDHLFKTTECIEEARLSCSCKGRGVTVGDEKLLRFLWEKDHSTPFEFAGLTIEVQAPLLVFREWHRHRTESYAERSARYTPLPDFNYRPTVERMMAGAVKSTNRQAASVDGADFLTIDSALEWLAELDGAYEHCERVYQSGLKRGVSKELARVIVPVGRYSVMRASTDLRNWLGFCRLRLAKGAQYEIRVYAEAVHRLLTERFPRTLALFDETRPA